MRTAKCHECGMFCQPGEFHPFASCLMYMGCHDSDKVRTNLAALSQPDEARDARKEARQHFLHEFGSELNDGEKWREWLEAQRQIEEEMPEGYCVILECSPGDWSLRFTDPEGEDIQIDDHESTASFIRDAVAIAKERERAAMSKEQP